MGSIEKQTLITSILVKSKPNDNTYIMRYSRATLFKNRLITMKENDLSAKEFSFHSLYRIWLVNCNEILIRLLP